MMSKKGIATGVHYPVPIHLQNAYGFLRYGKGDFPVVEQNAGRILSLPMFPELTEEQIRYIRSVLVEVVDKKCW
jgi:dTDP-4-amino-4,6-dideoxygalactose transaminase